MGNRIQIFENDKQVHDVTIYTWDDAPEKYKQLEPDPIAYYRDGSPPHMTYEVYVLELEHPRYPIKHRLNQIIGNGLYQYISDHYQMGWDSHHLGIYVVDCNKLVIIFVDSPRKRD